MKSTLKVLGIIGIVIGAFAIFGAATDSEPIYALLGGGLFLTYGIVMVNAAGRVDTQDHDTL